MSGRDELVRYVMDRNHSPAQILGAAVSFLRMSSSEGRRVANAVDETVRREIEAMKAEQFLTHHADTK